MSSARLRRAAARIPQPPRGGHTTLATSRGLRIVGTDRICYLAPVNFLSHGWLVRHAHSADVLIGSALPDLAPLADRQLRLTPKRLELLRGEGAEAVVFGCEHHRRVDREFHVRESFHTAQKAVSATLPAEGNPLPRNVLAHMLVEIGIDAEVLERDPAFVRETYARAFVSYDWPWLLERLERATGGDTRGLAAMVERFDGGSWLQTYRTDQGVLDRIRGMVVRLMKRPLDEDALQRLRPAVAEARRCTRERYDDLMPMELALPEGVEVPGRRG